MRLPKGYSFCTDETSYCLHDKKLFASQVNDTYIRHVLITLNFEFKYLLQKYNLSN